MKNQLRRWRLLNKRIPRPPTANVTMRGFLMVLIVSLFLFTLACRDCSPNPSRRTLLTLSSWCISWRCPRAILDICIRKGFIRQQPKRLRCFRQQIQCTRTRKYTSDNKLVIFCNSKLKKSYIPFLITYMHIYYLIEKILQTLCSILSKW